MVATQRAGDLPLFVPRSQSSDSLWDHGRPVCVEPKTADSTGSSCVREREALVALGPMGGSIQSSVCTCEYAGAGDGQLMLSGELVWWCV